jgi:hypothetical protein
MALFPLQFRFHLSFKMISQLSLPSPSLIPNGTLPPPRLAVQFWFNGQAFHQRIPLGRIGTLFRMPISLRTSCFPKGMGMIAILLGLVMSRI